MTQVRYISVYMKIQLNKRLKLMGWWTNLAQGGNLHQSRFRSDCLVCKHDLLLYDPWECVRLLPDSFFQFLSMTCRIEGDEKKFSVLYTKHTRNQDLWSWFLNWRCQYPTVQESSTLNMMMGPHNRRSTQGNAFFAACAWLLARDGVKQQCSNLHSGLYWMGAMHPATPVHGHARYISRVVKYKKKVFSNIWHHFSCLLDEEIAEILSILLLVVDDATDSITAKPCIQQDK